MKKMSIAVITVLLAFAGVANATLLIQDTFDTSNNTDINLDLATRQTGSLATTTWGENGLGSATIAGNALAIGGNNSESGAAIMVSLDHNFTDAAITSGGGFSVSFDMTHFGGTIGFALGLTDAGRKETTRTGAGGNYSFAWDRPSTDWGFTSQGGIYVQPAEAGAPIATFTALTANISYNIRVDVMTTGFIGTTATVDFYINDTLIDGGRGFTWDGDGGNYLTFGAYRPIPTGSIDNFSVSSIPEPATLSMIGVIGIAMLLRRRIVK
jgi:hypothetical protein